MKKIIVAIDGYSGTGKSSTAKEVANRLHYTFIDSGAMYRAVTFHCLQQKIDLKDLSRVMDELGAIKMEFHPTQQSALFLNGKLLADELRTMEVNQSVSDVAAITEVRREMVRQQKLMGKGKGIVMDGRDIGTMVFPEAELKVFMTSSPEVRGKRRQMELFEKGIHSDLETIVKNLKERDQIDSNRAEGPLRKAEGALEIDTSDLTFEEQVERIVQAAEDIIHEN